MAQNGQRDTLNFIIHFYFKQCNCQFYGSVSKQVFIYEGIMSRLNTSDIKFIWLGMVHIPVLLWRKGLCCSKSLLFSQKFVSVCDTIKGDIFLEVMKWF